LYCPDAHEIITAEEQREYYSLSGENHENNDQYKHATGTVDDIRTVIHDFYGEAGREIPPYFPEEPANREYNIGKRKWRQAQARGDVTFDRRDDHLIAAFDLEPHELYSFRKTLPTKMRPEKSGRNIIIKNPDAFTTWLDTDINSQESSSGWLSRFF
jgi:hypothetical protein